MIFRGDVSAIRFPDQVTPHPPTEEETALLRPLVERWCALFGGDAEALMDGPFTVVTPDSKNPYRPIDVFDHFYAQMRRRSRTCRS